VNVQIRRERTLGYAGFKNGRDSGRATMLVRGRSAAFVLGDEVKAAVLVREAGGSDASLSHRALSILAEALSGTMAAIDSLPYDPVANPRALPLMTLAASKFPFAFSRLVDVLCLPSCRSILPVANFSMQDAERVQLAARAVSLFGREARIAEFLTEDTNAVWALLALRVHADSHVCESAGKTLSAPFTDGRGSPTRKLTIGVNACRTGSPHVDAILGTRGRGRASSGRGGGCREPEWQ